MTIKMLIASAVAAGAIAVAAGPVFASTPVTQTKPMSPRMTSTSTQAGTVVAQASTKKHKKSEQNENENDAPGDAGDQGEQ